MSGYGGDGWEYLSDAVEQRVEEISEGPWTRYMGGDSITARLPKGSRALLKRAAHSRGIGMHAYVCRAVMAFVANDLQLDWAELMIDEHPIVKLGDPPRSRRPYAGAGFGDWRVRP